MSFKSKDITRLQTNYIDFSNLIKRIFNLRFFTRLFVYVFIFFIIFIAFSYINVVLKWFFKKVSKVLLIATSKTFGKQLEADDLWQINFLILWCGGEEWPGGWLTDTIMIASYNPNLKTVTFLSIPRDLYIEDKDIGYKGKINGLFATVYLTNKNKLWKRAAIDLAAKSLEKKIKEITDIQVQKYVIVTFKGFVDFINKLGGIDVYVPYTLIDTKYPTYDWGRTTIKFKKWWRHMNGRDALIYARSRHSTSDFSRSQRQQQIIKAVLNKLFSSKVLFDVSKLKQLYFQYSQMVFTDLSFKEILGLVQYIDKIKHFFSFVYTADCDWSSRKSVEPWCLLYYPPRDLFNGLSVLLPIGATPDNPGFYENMKKFAFIVIYNQKFLLENPKIQIENGVSKKFLYRKYWYAYPIASKLAKNLKVYAFNVVNVKNASAVYSWTIVFYRSWDDYSNTIELLKMFLPFEKVNKRNLTWDIDMNIIIGNDFIR